MPRSRVIYPTNYVYIGPSPATGHHFIHYTGLLNSDHTNLVQNHNLLMEINRVQEVSFSMAPTRTEVKQLGKRVLVSYPNLNEPNIRLDFDYLLNGLKNDARIGLNVNYAQYHYPNTGGTAKYANNFSVNILSGLMGRQFTQPTSDPFFPLPMRDNRNIFLVRCPEYDSFVKNDKEKITSPDFFQKGADPESTGYEVLAFGNCYLERYRTQGAINSIPNSSTSWSCENAAFYLSGSGCLTPAVNPQTRERVNDNKFVIPVSYNEGGPHILNPGDILLDISCSGTGATFTDWGGLNLMDTSGDWGDLTAMTTSGDWGDLTVFPFAGDGLSGLAINFSNIMITNYQIDMDLRREPLSSLGYKLPLDRQINFPVYVDLNFGMTVGDTTPGSFIDFLNIDSGYNISIKLRNPLCRSPFVTSTGNPRQSGPVFSGEGHTAISYDFRDAKFMGINYNTSIGRSAAATLSFRSEINPDVPNKGFYISGLLNIEKLEDFLVDENGDIIVDEDMGAVVGNYRPLY